MRTSSPFAVHRSSIGGKGRNKNVGRHFLSGGEIGKRRLIHTLGPGKDSGLRGGKPGIVICLGSAGGGELGKG